MADVRGYVYEHRIIAENKLGRELLPGEIVHHIDNNRKNNQPDNILVCKGIAEHKKEHRPIDSMRRNPEEANIIIECSCGCGETLDKYDSSGRPRKFIKGHSSKTIKHTWSGSPRKPGSKLKPIGEENYIIECSCGCGQKINKYDNYGRPRIYISGHNKGNKKI